MRGKIKAVVFDMDGTLVDSRELIYQAMEDGLAARGLHVSREQMAAVTGKPIYAMYELLAPNENAQELEQAHVAHHAKHMHLLSEYDHVHEVLAGLQRQRIRLGVFTGFDKRAYERLRQFHLMDYFTTVVDATRYSRHKPDPEGLLLAMMELGATPAETIYVGDGVSDVLAGKQAGTQVIAVTHGFGSAQSLQDAGADYVVSSFRELQSVIQAELDNGS